MAKYEILTNSLGKKIAVYFPDGKFKEWVTSTVPLGKVEEFPELHQFVPLTQEERSNAIITRLPQYAKCRTLAIGDPDFLPFSFLGRGLRCGQAVCRLIQEFSVGELVYLLTTNNYVVEEVSEIVAILLDTLHLGDSVLALSLDGSDYSLGGKEAISSLIDTHLDIKIAIEAHQNERILVPAATGFLVGRNTLLTNAHVFSDPSNLSQFSAEFKYEEDFVESNPVTVRYPIEQILIKDDRLDYALVQLKPLKKDESGLSFEEAGDNFGWLPLSEDPNAIAPPVTKEELEKLSFEGSNDSIPDRVRAVGWRGDAVNIIQHPRGRQKEIVLYDSRVKQLYSDLLEYVTDVEPGTSGSPVFNAQWQLVALHRSVLLDVDETAGEIKSISCLGTRISSIVTDLEKRKNEPSIETFFNKFVIKEGKTPSRGKIFLFAGRQRHISVKPDLEAQWMQSIAQKIAAQFPKNGFEIELVSTDLTEDKMAIDWINQQGYQAGYMAIDLCMMISQNPDLRGVSVAYVGVNAERKSHAQIVLKSLLQNHPDLDSQGTVSDWSVNPNGLDFCRVVKMPSLVLYLGCLTNPEDCRIVGDDQQQEKIASGLVKGLVKWANMLSPVPI
jgi:Trypsin-like peptidase domain/N-acetylmuramoyl-L-alanine amidase